MRIGVEREWWQNYGSKYKSALRIGHTLQVPYCSVASGSRSCGACRLVWLRGGGGAGAFGVGHEPSAAVPRSSATSAPSAASRGSTFLRCVPSLSRPILRAPRWLGAPRDKSLAPAIGAQVLGSRRHLGAAASLDARRRVGRRGSGTRCRQRRGASGRSHGHDITEFVHDCGPVRSSYKLFETDKSRRACVKTCERDDCVSNACRHLVGYLSIKLKLLSRNTETGLAAYVATIGLPSLLFKAVTTLRCSQNTP